MIKIYLAAFVIGLLLGPGYGIYCHYFSGETAQTVTLFELTEDKERWNKTEAKAVPFESGTAAFSLTPEMNPIALNMKAQLYRVTPGTLQKHLDFTGSLTGDAGLVWQDAHRLTWKQSKKKGGDLRLTAFAKSVIGSELAQRTATVHSQLNVFEVKEAGSYTLAITQAGEKDGEIATLDVTVRKNVTLVNSTLFAAGCILLTLGILASVYTYNKRRKTI